MMEYTSIIKHLPDELLNQRIEALEQLGSLDISAIYVGSRIYITNPKHGYALYKLLYIGKPLAIRKPKPIRYNTTYALSHYEALYLLRKGIIKITGLHGEPLGSNELIELANRIIDDFTSKYLVYEDLRNRGFIVRSGLKYGAEFLVYIYGPGIDHSPFVVSVYSEKIRLRGLDFLKSGRLSWSVRKRWVMAITLNANWDNPKIAYLVFGWNKELSL